MQCEWKWRREVGPIPKICAGELSFCIALMNQQIETWLESEIVYSEKWDVRSEMKDSISQLFAVSKQILIWTCKMIKKTLNKKKSG